MGWGIRPISDIWLKARTGAVECVYVSIGERSGDGLTAPIACYRYRAGWGNCDTYMLLQHGSYLPIEVAEQPLIKDRQLVLYRGLGKKRTFSWRLLNTNLSLKQNLQLQRYLSSSRSTSKSAHAFCASLSWSSLIQCFFCARLRYRSNSRCRAGNRRYSFRIAAIHSAVALDSSMATQAAARSAA